MVETKSRQDELECGQQVGPCPTCGKPLVGAGLKPCPFCGGTPIVMATEQGPPEAWIVCCCGVKTNRTLGKNGAEAVVRACEKWNHRQG